MTEPRRAAVPRLIEVTWSVVVNDEWMCLVQAETSGAAIVMAGDVWREAFPDDQEGIRVMSAHRGDLRTKLRTGVRCRARRLHARA